MTYSTAAAYAAIDAADTREILSGLCEDWLGYKPFDLFPDRTPEEVRGHLRFHVESTARKNGEQPRAPDLYRIARDQLDSAFSRHDLAALYERWIGYDPFDDDPACDPAEVRRTLSEVIDECEKAGARVDTTIPA